MENHLNFSLNMSNKKKRSWKPFVIVAIILAILFSMFFFNKRNKKEGIAITTEKVEKRTITETVSASGRIFPEKEIKISSDVSGEVVELFVAEGDSVVAGQILAKIDPDAYISAVERGKATLNSAKSQKALSESQIESNIAQKEQILAQLKNAQNIYDRNVTLHNDGVISDADLENSLASLEGIKANIKSAEASIRASQKSVESAAYNIESTAATLKELQTSLNRTTIKAPTSGIVSSLSVEQGERVVGTMQMAGTEMMRIANLNNMEVQVDVSENDIVKVNLRDTVDIEVDAYLDKTFKGTISEIANSASNIVGSSAMSLNTDQVTNFTVKISIDPNSYKDLQMAGKQYPFHPGMSASVDIFTDKASDVITVPIQAVTTRVPEDENNKKEYEEIIFSHVGDSVQVNVVTTGIQDDEYIQITNGIDYGTDIVSGPYSAISSKLEQGKQVYIQEEKDEKSDKKKK